MEEFCDADGYWEPEEPEISGPVAPTRPRAVLRILAQLIYPKSPGWIPVVREYERPQRTGPP